MRKTQNVVLNIDDKELITTEELQSVLSCGRYSATKIGTAAAAKVKIGSRVLWNVRKIRLYIDSISQ